MHLIRRSAFRAMASPSTSFVSKSRSITTSSPFITRIKPQVSISPIFRRFASDDIGTEARQSETESTPSSADSEDQSSIASAISSASESVSTYASDAAQRLTKNASAAKDTMIDRASGVAAAAGFAGEGTVRSRNIYGAEQRSSASPDSVRDRRRDSEPMKPTNSIYIGNLLFDVGEEDLKREFSEYGNIQNVVLARDARSLSKGFGYVTFDSVDAATAAIQAKDQTVLDGRRIIVNYQLKTNRPPSTPNEPSKTLFIGNLAFEMSDADLNKLFRDIKNVMDVRVAIDRRTGQPRGFAHADFMDVESAVKGFDQLQGMELYGRTLRVDYAAGSSRSASKEGSRY